MHKTFILTILLAATLLPAVGTAQDHGSPEKVDRQLFEASYRAAKALEGAADTGTTYAKYLELLQVFTTELSIVKDARPSGTQNIQLVGLLEDVLGHYRAAGAFWNAKLQAPQRGPSRQIKGIPVYYEKQKTDDSMLKLAERYDLPIEKANAGGSLAGKLEYRWIPSDSPQRVLVIAADTLKKAADLYHGR